MSMPRYKSSERDLNYLFTDIMGGADFGVLMSGGTPPSLKCNLDRGYKMLHGNNIYSLENASICPQSIL